MRLHLISTYLFSGSPADPSGCPLCRVMDSDMDEHFRKKSSSGRKRSVPGDVLYRVGPSSSLQLFRMQIRDFGDLNGDLDELIYVSFCGLSSTASLTTLLVSFSQQLEQYRGRPRAFAGEVVGSLLSLSLLITVKFLGSVKILKSLASLALYSHAINIPIEYLLS